MLYTDEMLDHMAHDMLYRDNQAMMFAVLKKMSDAYEFLMLETLRQHMARIAELEANQWTPVPDGGLVPTITDGKMWAYERDGKRGKAIVFQKDHFHGDIILADDYAVCRRQEADK
jgi:hypothetical protein